MKITIDTKEDSHEDIKRVIAMLQHLVGEQAYINKPRDIFEDSSPAIPSSGGVFGNIFEASKQTGKAEDSPVIKTKEDEDIPEVIPY